MKPSNLCVVTIDWSYSISGRYFLQQEHHWLDVRLYWDLNELDLWLRLENSDCLLVKWLSWTIGDRKFPASVTSQAPVSLNIKAHLYFMNKKQNKKIVSWSKQKIFRKTNNHKTSVNKKKRQNRNCFLQQLLANEQFL